MATESELKTLLADIELSEEETEGYRDELAARLPSVKPVRRVPFPIWAAAAAALLVLAISLWPTTALEEPDLESLIARVEEDREGSIQKARKKLDRDGIAGLNARMILCMTSPEEEAVEHAVTGLRDDPRATFRRYYLERLLDAGDLVRYDRYTIQALIDNETDPICVDLFRHLLRWVV